MIDRTNFTGELPTNISLAGMRGSGKTTTGAKLAELTGKKFVDIDVRMTKRFGPISQVIGTYGIGWFRARESELCWELGREDGLVIATGGGTVIQVTDRGIVRPNRDSLQALRRRGGVVVGLQASLPTLIQRVGDEPTQDRPLIAGGATMAEDMARLMNKRKQAYFGAVEFEVNAEATPYEVAASILAMLESPLQPGELWFMPQDQKN